MFNKSLMNKKEIEYYITWYSFFRNARQVKIDLYIHYLNKIQANLKTIQRNIQSTHKRLIIQVYRKLSHIINDVLIVLFNNYSYSPIKYEYSLPHYLLLQNLKTEIINQTSIEASIIIIDALKTIYNAIPNDQSMSIYNLFNNINNILLLNLL
jgi:hypothetical protein